MKVPEPSPKLEKSNETGNSSMLFKDIIKRKCISSVDNEVAATIYLERISLDKALLY